MVKEQSNKAKKRAAKEAELLESSWKLAHTMYGPMWGEERWTELSKALREKTSALVLNNYRLAQLISTSLIKLSDKSLPIKDEFQDWSAYRSVLHRTLAADCQNKETERLTANSGAFRLDNESLIIAKCLALEEGNAVLGKRDNYENHFPKNRHNCRISSSSHPFV